MTDEQRTAMLNHLLPFAEWGAPKGATLTPADLLAARDGGVVHTNREVVGTRVVDISKIDFSAAHYHCDAFEDPTEPNVLRIITDAIQDTIKHPEPEDWYGGEVSNYPETAKAVLDALRAAGCRL